MVVRVRPLSDKEIHSGHKSMVETDDMNCSLIVTNPSAQSGEPPKVFTFDSVFGADSKQVSVVVIVTCHCIHFYRYRNGVCPDEILHKYPTV